MKRSNTFK